MNNGLDAQIYNNLNLKETDELLDVWQTNDRVEWSDSAFNAIRQILANRGVELPEQNEPIQEHNEDDENFGFTDEEWKIIDDPNPPVFYDTLDVLLMTKRIETAAIASIILVVLSALLQFPETRNLTESLLQGYPPLVPYATLMAVVSSMIAIGIAIITTYIPLRVLARILKILMEMEFNSRK